jgi:two-component system phosphate regulon sensor histidine kinase PhoR
MLIWGLRFLYLLAVVALSGYLWGRFISESTQIWFALCLLATILAYQLWNSQRLMQILVNDDLVGKSRGLGNWREIYYLLQKYAKDWRQKLSLAQDQQEKFIQAIQASPNGILMLDEGDHIEWCNGVSERHFGVNSKRDAMQKLTYLIRHPTFIQYIQNKRYDEPIQLDGMGNQGNLSLSIQVFPYGGNRKLMLSQDITQTKKNEAMRRDFVANVSHELRTPLTVLSGFLETVRELKLTEEDRRRYLDLMHVQSGRMTALVEDLLILSTLESSPPPPSKQSILIQPLLNRLVQDAQGLSNGKHQIITEFSSQKNLQGDEKEIYSAFGNLITNAIRYTPEGGKVTIQWQDEQDGAFFAVHDSGPGIAPEHIPRLTERFYRVDRSRSRDTGGTGLGLAIVKHIVTRHNASLGIQSELGKGSLFTISFPSWRLQEQNSD